MKFVSPDINYIFDTSIPYVNSLVIENPDMMRGIINQIYSQISGDDGLCVLSNNDKEIDLAKHTELISDYVSFSLNQKALITKVTSVMEKEAVSEDMYRATSEILSRLEAYCFNLSQRLPCDVQFSKININAVLKCVGIELNDEYDSLAEKLLDYFELVSEFDKEKLFFLVNLRSYISDNEMEEFFITLLKRHYNVIMIDGFEHKRLINEKRIIIDYDLCEIQ